MNVIGGCVFATHPGFEHINNVWFAMIEFLRVISRMNDLDLRNLGLLLQDINIYDIARKLVVFNNVQYRNSCISHDMENLMMLDKFKDLIQGDELKQELTGSDICKGNICGTVEFYHDPFLFSKELSLYQREGKRNIIFSEMHLEDPFSQGIRVLSDFINVLFL